MRRSPSTIFRRSAQWSRMMTVCACQECKGLRSRVCIRPCIFRRHKRKGSSCHAANCLWNRKSRGQGPSTVFRSVCTHRCTRPPCTGTTRALVDPSAALVALPWGRSDAIRGARLAHAHATPRVTKVLATRSTLQIASRVAGFGNEAGATGRLARGA